MYFYFRIDLYNFTSSQQLFVTTRDNSYECNTKTTIANVLDTDNVTITSIEIENLRVQPFYDATNGFSGYKEGKIRITKRIVFICLKCQFQFFI